MTSNNLADTLRPAQPGDGREWAPAANTPYGIIGKLSLTPGVREVQPPQHQIGRFVMEFDDAS